MTDPIRAAEAVGASCRSLLEEVARMGHCIGQHTVGEITSISDRAAAWLAENPPGQIAQPAPPAEGEMAELVALISQIALSWEPDACLLGNMTARQLTRVADLLQHGQSALYRLHRLQQENARFREPERTILCDILANGTLLSDPDGKRYGVPPAEGWAHPDKERATRAADLLAQRHPTPVPVSERPILKSSPFNDSQGRCWCGTGGLIDQTGDMPIEYPASWELREPSHGDDWLLPCNALPLPAGETPVNKGSESPLSEFGPNDMPLG